MPISIGGRGINVGDTTVRVIIPDPEPARSVITYAPVNRYAVNRTQAVVTAPTRLLNTQGVTAPVLAALLAGDLEGRSPIRFLCRATNAQDPAAQVEALMPYPGVSLPLTPHFAPASLLEWEASGDDRVMRFDVWPSMVQVVSVIVGGIRLVEPMMAVQPMTGGITVQVGWDAVPVTVQAPA